MFEQFTQDTSTTAFLVWNGILGCVTIAGGAAAVVCHRRTQAMTATPTSTIGRAGGGYVEVEGRAKSVAEAGLKSPLTGIPCVWYEYEITKQMGGHGSDTHSRWVTVERGRSEDVFVLRDETGECLVDPQGAKVISAPADTDRWIGHDARPTRGPEKRGPRGGLFPGQSYSTFRFGRGLWFSTRKDYRYTERRIRPGAPLYVLGSLEGQRSGSGAPSVSTKELLRVWKQDQRELLKRFDADGRIDANEWEAARLEAEAQVTREQAQDCGARALAVLGAPRDRGRPFLISAIPQQALIARYRLYTGIGLAVAVLAGLGMGTLIAAG
jgi:hypothetical protein